MRQIDDRRSGFIVNRGKIIHAEKGRFLHDATIAKRGRVEERSCAREIALAWLWRHTRRKCARFRQWRRWMVLRTSPAMPHARRSFDSYVSRRQRRRAWNCPGNDSWRVWLTGGWSSCGMGSNCLKWTMEYLPSSSIRVLYLVILWYPSFLFQSHHLWWCLNFNTLECLHVWFQLSLESIDHWGKFHLERLEKTKQYPNWNNKWVRDSWPRKQKDIKTIKIKETITYQRILGGGASRVASPSEFSAM